MRTRSLKCDSFVTKGLLMAESAGSWINSCNEALVWWIKGKYTDLSRWKIKKQWVLGIEGIRHPGLIKVLGKVKSYF